MEEITYSVLIAEDEVPARELLVDYLLSRPELKLSYIAKNGEDALQKLSLNHYDLVMMDIHLPCISGIEVLQQLKTMPYVIFTTAYDKYAINAFAMGAVDYLMKPFTIERFNQSIEKFLSMHRTRAFAVQPEHESCLSFKDDGRHHIIPYHDIVYCTSHGKHTSIHTSAGDYEAAIMMKDIEYRLPSDSFIRVHKQHIINIRYISMFEYYIGGQYIVFLKDQDESALPVGKKYALIVKQRFKLE